MNGISRRPPVKGSYWTYSRNAVEIALSVEAASKNVTECRPSRAAQEDFHKFSAEGARAQEGDYTTSSNGMEEASGPHAFKAGGPRSNVCQPRSRRPCHPITPGQTVIFTPINPQESLMKLNMKKVSDLLKLHCPECILMVYEQGP
ncbi:hypothetical protein HPB47_020009 [Ixodes persulcatus]|uniref:Uncharacterized protein n=1 Tax=Ixodes persulcatus TaxID=34615 RepID=A0AC60QGP1_IXOPE|nr:hypothetical protein HPB47_020009 [Ixodes persulcatus]